MIKKTLKKMKGLKSSQSPLFCMARVPYADWCERGEAERLPTIPIRLHESIKKEGDGRGKPPILNFASSRNPVNQHKSFFYDAALNLNLIEINGSRVPFVDVPPMFTTELYTKTEAIREDDEEGAGLVELQTKTMVQHEDDDDDYRFLDLLTKTKVERESDDE